MIIELGLKINGTLFGWRKFKGTSEVLLALEQFFTDINPEEIIEQGEKVGEK